jgi:DNA-binding CsgD family transcriptional regulator
MKKSIEERITEKINEIDATAQEMPGVVIVHNMQDLTIRYMSKRGLEILGVTLDELIGMGRDYHDRFFNSEENKEMVPKMIGLLERNNNEEIVALFQQVRANKHQPWNWYCTSLKILMRDDEGKPLLTIAIAIPIDPAHNLSHKVSRLLEENNFLRKHNAKFRELSNRERLLLKYFALGKTSAEIAAELHLSALTVNTHKKNIKQKLGTSNVYELAEYARAFDLI